MFKPQLKQYVFPPTINVLMSRGLRKFNIYNQLLFKFATSVVSFAFGFVSASIYSSWTCENKVGLNQEPSLVWMHTIVNAVVDNQLQWVTAPDRSHQSWIMQMGISIPSVIDISLKQGSHCGVLNLYRITIASQYKILAWESILEFQFHCLPNEFSVNTTIDVFLSRLLKPDRSKCSGNTLMSASPKLGSVCKLRLIKWLVDSLSTHA